MLLEIFDKLVDRGMVRAFSRKDYLSTCEINHYCDIVMAFFAGFVHADAVNLGIVFKIPSGVDVMLYEAPQTV